MYIHARVTVPYILVPQTVLATSILLATYQHHWTSYVANLPVVRPQSNVEF